MQTEQELEEVNFKVEDNLLFWNGYMVSTAYSELSEKELHMIASICNLLADYGYNPEDYFSFSNRKMSYSNLKEAYDMLKGKSLN